MNELLKSVLSSEYFDENNTTNIFTSNILNNLNIYVFVFDAENKIPVWINDYFNKRMGYTNDDLKTVTPESFLQLFIRFHKNSSYGSYVVLNLLATMIRKPCMKLKRRINNGFTCWFAVRYVREIKRVK